MKGQYQARTENPWGWSKNTKENRNEFWKW
jgi:hypothetical protein